MSKKRRRKFYRATLASIVWNPKTNKPLAEFVNGVFYTRDDEVAEILLSKGYPEVPLDSKRPPMIVADAVPETGDVKIMSPQMTEESMAAKIKRDDKLSEDEDPGPGFTVMEDVTLPSHVEEEEEDELDETEAELDDEDEDGPAIRRVIKRRDK